MDQFLAYFKVGFGHIVSKDMGVDHILFIVALAIRYQFADWRKLLILVTAFTIGHSVTLALSVFNIVNYSIVWIEFLIPVTIVITALSNFFVKKFSFNSRFPLIYFFALFFGLIHGLGFSNYLKSMLGKDSSVIWELFAFNVGLELGQLLIVLVMLIISFIFVNLLKCNRREFLLYISGGAFAVALLMALERVPQ
ncbi:MAG TPA: HupE / UreJ protein [Chitinophagaceae bacterium]|nr:HupE / UreJ protein [Chitinophagaceae bacterium]